VLGKIPLSPSAGAAARGFCSSWRVIRAHQVETSFNEFFHSKKTGGGKTSNNRLTVPVDFVCYVTNHISGFLEAKWQKGRGHL
jgi:hypothetical protein